MEQNISHQIYEMYKLLYPCFKITSRTRSCLQHVHNVISALIILILILMAEKSIYLQNKFILRQANGEKNVAFLLFLYTKTCNHIVYYQIIMFVYNF